MAWYASKLRLAGRRLLAEIGSGAHGVVFLVDGPKGHVALKVCRKPDDPARAADWEREKRGWALFSRIPPHPGLVRVFATGELAEGAAFWVTMELADPEPGCSTDNPSGYRPLTLASVAAAEVALPLARCLQIGERLASALEHLQRHHLLHRDVKPGNVLFVKGRPVIADAGLVVDEREAASLVGTPGYEPPEHHGTPQGDVFSLGRTLWRIGTGRSPEEAGFAPCAEADTSDPDFWRFLAIVGKATSPIPSRRYRSAKALRKDLARLRRRQGRKPRKLPRILAATAAILLIVATLWNLYPFQFWLAQDQEYRDHVPLPFPYSLARPLLVSPDAPSHPDYRLFSREMEEVWSLLCIGAARPSQPTQDEKRRIMEQAGFEWSDEDWNRAMKLWWNKPTQ